MLHTSAGNQAVKGTRTSTEPTSQLPSIGSRDVVADTKERADSFVCISSSNSSSSSSAVDSLPASPSFSNSVLPKRKNKKIKCSYRIIYHSGQRALIKELLQGKMLLVEKAIAEKRLSFEIIPEFKWTNFGPTSLTIMYVDKSVALVTNPSIQEGDGHAEEQILPENRTGNTQSIPLLIAAILGGNIQAIELLFNNNANLEVNADLKIGEKIYRLDPFLCAVMSSKPELMREFYHSIFPDTVIDQSHCNVENAIKILQLLFKKRKADQVSPSFDLELISEAENKERSDAVADISTDFQDLKLLVKALRAFVPEDEIVKELIKNLNIQHEDLPLSYFVPLRSAVIIRWAVERGGDINARSLLDVKDNSVPQAMPKIPVSYTPLLNAINLGDIPVAALLLELGADPNIPNIPPLNRNRKKLLKPTQPEQEYSPLMLAISRGQPSMMELLLNSKKLLIDLYYQTSYGETAFSLASKSDNDQIKAVLERYKKQFSPAASASAGQFDLSRYTHIDQKAVFIFTGKDVEGERFFFTAEGGDFAFPIENEGFIDEKQILQIMKMIKNSIRLPRFTPNTLDMGYLETFFGANYCKSRIILIDMGFVDTPTLNRKFHRSNRVNKGKKKGVRILFANDFSKLDEQQESKENAEANELGKDADSEIKKVSQLSIQIMQLILKMQTLRTFNAQELENLASMHKKYLQIQHNFQEALRRGDAKGVEAFLKMGASLYYTIPIADQEVDQSWKQKFFSGEVCDLPPIEAAIYLKHFDVALLLLDQIEQGNVNHNIERLASIIAQIDHHTLFKKLCEKNKEVILKSWLDYARIIVGHSNLELLRILVVFYEVEMKNRPSSISRETIVEELLRQALLNQSDITIVKYLCGLVSKEILQSILIIKGIRALAIKVPASNEIMQFFKEQIPESQAGQSDQQIGEQDDRFNPFLVEPEPSHRMHVPDDFAVARERELQARLNEANRLIDIHTCARNLDLEPIESFITERAWGQRECSEIFNLIIASAREQFTVKDRAEESLIEIQNKFVRMLQFFIPRVSCFFMRAAETAFIIQFFLAVPREDQDVMYNLMLQCDYPDRFFPILWEAAASQVNHAVLVRLKATRAGDLWRMNDKITSSMQTHATNLNLENIEVLMSFFEINSRSWRSILSTIVDNIQKLLSEKEKSDAERNEIKNKHIQMLHLIVPKLEKEFVEEPAGRFLVDFYLRLSSEKRDILFNLHIALFLNYLNLHPQHLECIFSNLLQSLKIFFQQEKDEARKTAVKNEFIGALQIFTPKLRQVEIKEKDGQTLCDFYLESSREEQEIIYALMLANKNVFSQFFLFLWRFAITQPNQTLLEKLRSSNAIILKEIHDEVATLLETHARALNLDNIVILASHIELSRNQYLDVLDVLIEHLKRFISAQENSGQVEEIKNKFIKILNIFIPKMGYLKTKVAEFLVGFYLMAPKVQQVNIFQLMLREHPDPREFFAGLWKHALNNTRGELDKLSLLVELVLLRSSDLERMSLDEVNALLKTMFSSNNADLIKKVVPKLPHLWIKYRLEIKDCLYNIPIHIKGEELQIYRNELYDIYALAFKFSCRDYLRSAIYRFMQRIDLLQNRPRTRVEKKENRVAQAGKVLMSLTDEDLYGGPEYQPQTGSSSGTLLFSSSASLLGLDRSVSSSTSPSIAIETIASNSAMQSLSASASASASVSSASLQVAKPVSATSSSGSALASAPAEKPVIKPVATPSLHHAEAQPAAAAAASGRASKPVIVKSTKAAEVRAAAARKKIEQRAAAEAGRDQPYKKSGNERKAWR